MPRLLSSQTAVMSWELTGTCVHELVVIGFLLISKREHVDLGLLIWSGGYMVYQWGVAWELPRKST